MPTSHPRDRFDDVPRDRSRVGAHRAENPRMRAGVVLLWAIVATIVLIAIGIVAFVFVSQRADLGPGETEPATAQTVEPVLDTEYTVLVLNGTAREGLAADVKPEIVAAGWSDALVLASESATQDFPTTTIYYAEEGDRPAAAGLAELLGDVPVVQSDAYQDSEHPDAKELTVILGTDRLADAGAPEAGSD